MATANEAKIKELLGGEYIVTQVERTKNNGVTLVGYNIRKDGDSISPIIFADGVADDDVARYVVGKFNRIKDSTPAFDVDSILSRNYILENVYPELINKERNEGIFDNVIHTPYLDLEVVYRIRIKANPNDTSIGSILIKNSLLSAKNITESELHDAAMQNIKRNNVVEPLLGLMSDYVRNITGEEPQIPDGDDDEAPMLFVSNKENVHGAGVILDPDLLWRIYEMLNRKEFYVLPSSIHEVLVVRKVDDSLDSIMELVHHVNMYCVDSDEFLSDSVYVFNGKRLEVAR